MSAQPVHPPRSGDTVAFINPVKIISPLGETAMLSSWSTSRQTREVSTAPSTPERMALKPSLGSRDGAASSAV